MLQKSKGYFRCAVFHLQVPESFGLNGNLVFLDSRMWSSRKWLKSCQVPSSKSVKFSSRKSWSFSSSLWALHLAEMLAITWQKIFKAKEPDSFGIVQCPLGLGTVCPGLPSRGFVILMFMKKNSNASVIRKRQAVSGEDQELVYS